MPSAAFNLALSTSYCHLPLDQGYAIGLLTVLWLTNLYLQLLPHYRRDCLSLTHPLVVLVEPSYYPLLGVLALPTSFKVRLPTDHPRRIVPRSL